MYIADALEAGVSGYVLKSQVSSDLLLAIRQVQSGHVYISRAFPALSLPRTSPVLDNKKSDVLTLRERQVLQLIAEGKTTRDVASLLFISVKTAEHTVPGLCRNWIFMKPPALVRYAIRRGLVQP